MIKAIIFDFDGVIFDSEPLHFEACYIVFKKYGITLDYDEYFAHYVGLSDKEIFPKVLSTHQMPLQQDEINQLIEMKIDTYYEIVNTKNDLHPIDGIHEFLAMTHQHHLKIAICSGSKRKEIDIALLKLSNGSLKKYFQIIVTIDNLSQGKPSPEGYLYTAKQLNIHPKNCLAIEDSPHGIKAAKAANMEVIALLTTSSVDKLSQADKIVKDFYHLNLSSYLRDYAV